jgi:hypothetical protein
MPDSPHTVRPGPQRDEAEGYRPISAVAVAALAVSGLTVLTVLGIWLTAKVRGRPVLVPGILFVAAVGLGLALAARWHVLRSQGTRSGLRLTTIAFWLSLFAFGGYGASYLATDWAVRLQARDVADRFFGFLAESKPELAFRLTRPPAQQRGIELDPEKIRARFGAAELFAFNGLDLTRTFRTWKGDRTRLQFAGERSRDDKPDGFEVELNYGLRTPEGEYEVAVSARGVDDKESGLREWHIQSNRTGLRAERRLTQLGRLCSELQFECGRRYVRFRWLPEMQKQTPEETAAVVRVEGAVPRTEIRDAVLADVRRPEAISFFPGSGPLRNPGLPTMVFTPDAVLLRMIVEVNAPSVDKDAPRIPADLTVRVVNHDLEQELLKLAGPGWEQQPLLANDPEASPALEPYGIESLLQVTELNLRPSQPRIAPAAPNSP